MKSYLVSQLLDSANKYSSKIAVVDSVGTNLRKTTFAELMQNACKVASFIQQAHVAPQSFISIELPESMEFIAAQLGIWFSGCVAVPVGIHFPKERKYYIRKHCDSALHIDKNQINAILSSSQQADIAIPDETDNALLIYTSGSTGNPKGILHDFKSLMNAVKMMRVYTPTAEDRFAAAIPPYFIAELFYMLIMFGTEVHIVPEDVAKDIQAVAAYHRDNEITVAFISATVYPLYKCCAPSMRCVFTGSDRVVCNEKPDYRLLNVYGLSETAGPMIYADITEPTDNAPIGLPVDGIAFALLDDDMNPVAKAEEGEICLKGYFAKSYYKDEEQTAQLYRGGWLHTKDLGKMTPDGRIQFVNRKDWMVKVNGQRVEPGEIEASMRKIGGLSKAVVKGFMNSQKSQYLVGYYTLDSKGSLTEAEIRNALCKTLPLYMVPTFLVELDNFPLNANGKIDRKALVAPSRKILQESYVAPTNATELALCKAFEKNLQLEKVGIDDDFVRLGGDSIRMMKVQNECPELNVSAKMVYQLRTPRKIALELQSNKRLSQVQDLPDYPLNIVQNVFYGFCQMLPPNATIFNFPVLYRLGSNVDLQRMAKAIEIVVAAHPSMSMKIITKDNGVLRLVNDKEFKFSLSPEKVGDDEFAKIQNTLVQPFQLIDSQMFRIKLFETPTAKYLFYDFHHLIFDGVSIQVFHDEINKAYANEPVSTEESTIFEINVEEELLIGSEVYNEARNWFAEEFKNGPKETVPPPDKIPAPGMPSFGKIRRKLKIPSQNELESICKKKSITLNVLFMSAGAYLVGQYCKTNEALVSASYHGRTELRQQRTFGFLAKPREMLFRWQNGMGVDDYLQASKNHMMGNMTRDIYPITQMGAEIGLSRNVVLYMYEGSLEGNNPILCGERAQKTELSNNLSASPICYYIYAMEDGGFDILAVYVDSLYSKEYMEKSIKDFESVINQMLTISKLENIKI